MGGGTGSGGTFDETRLTMQSKLQDILGAEYAGLANAIEEELFQYYV